MDMLSIIQQKKRGGELPGEAIDWVVGGALSGEIPDYQLSALLMAICYEGLAYGETVALTRAFIDSGDVFQWPGMSSPVVDKHSTGGVGDTVSLLLVPWLAEAGFVVPKMSGRGLGHTGGTIDKLESIPGFVTGLSRPEVSAALQRVGCVIVSQTASLVPADKKFYALRDATATIDETGLIAASVMSKKIAGGADFIVLDVKCGKGAFFGELVQARAFADVCIRLGHEFGRKTGCIISRMDQPLSRSIGNALEVVEVLDLLESLSRFHDSRLVRLAAALGGMLHVLAGRCESLGSGKERMYAVEPARIRQRFADWVTAQGGDLKEFYRIVELKLRSGEPGPGASGYRQIAIAAGATGFVESVDALAIGELARSLGAGRKAVTDLIDPYVGIAGQVMIGERIVKPDQVLATVFAQDSDSKRDEDIAELYLRAVKLSGDPVEHTEPVIETVF